MTNVSNNVLSGTFIGDLNVTDTVGDTFTFSASPTTYFNVSDSTLVTNQTNINEWIYNVSITVTDQGNLTYTEGFNISVANVNNSITNTTGTWSSYGGSTNTFTGDTAEELFGYSVDISDDGTKAIAVDKHSGTDNVDAFIYSIGGEYTTTDTKHSISLSGGGTTFAIGNPTNKQVKVYSTSNNWTTNSQKGSTLSESSNNNGYDWAVTLSKHGNVLHVGVPDSKKVYSYLYQSSSWTGFTNNVTPVNNNDKYGYSLAT